MSTDRDAGAEIRLESLTKLYPGQDRPAVDALDLTIPAGETVVFVGPSGCGKTTSLKMINRLIEPTSGRILIGGEDITRRDPTRLRRQIGYVVQGGGMMPHLSVAENVGLVPRLLKWDRRRIADRVDELLDLVGLDPAIYRDRFPRELSGGQQQRVGVARGLAADPPVLLMDEPFGAVDPLTRERLQQEMLDIQARVGKTIVMVTHDVDEAVLKRLGLRSVDSLPLRPIAQHPTGTLPGGPVLDAATPISEALAALVTAPTEEIAVVRDGTVIGLLDYPTLRAHARAGDEQARP